MNKIIFSLFLLFPQLVFAQWVFTRSSVAYKDLASGPTSISQVAVNVPRGGGVGGGVLIEGPTIQLHGLTEAFDSWTNTGLCAVTPNAAISPDGNLTADLLDNTGGTHGEARYISPSMGNINGRTFTRTVWVKAAIPHTFSMRFWAVGEVVNQNFYATTEWQRFVFTHTFTVSVSTVIELDTYPGEHAVATGAAYFFGSNLTETAFATSYIQNTGAVGTTVTRTSDSLSMPIHQASTNKDILPSLFGPSPNQANKLTIEFQAKCEYAATSIEANWLTISGGPVAGRNEVIIEAYNDNKIYGIFYDSVAGAHYFYTNAAPVDYSIWHTYKLLIDFSDLSRMNFWIDGTIPTMTWVGRVGDMKTFDTTDANLSLKIGSGRVGGDAFCQIKNLRINGIEY